MSSRVQTAIRAAQVRFIDTDYGQIELSILGAPARWRFRLSAKFADSALVVTVRADGTPQGFDLIRRGPYWESAEAIPEPHHFGVTLVLGHGEHVHSYRARFVEHGPGLHPSLGPSLGGSASSLKQRYAALR